MSIPMQRMTLLLTPLLRRIYCVVSQTTTGAETKRLHRARVPAGQRSLQCTTELSGSVGSSWVEIFQFLLGWVGATIAKVLKI